MRDAGVIRLDDKKFLENCGGLLPLRMRGVIGGIGFFEFKSIERCRFEIIGIVVVELRHAAQVLISAVRVVFCRVLVDRSWLRFPSAPSHSGDLAAPPAESSLRQFRKRRSAGVQRRARKFFASRDRRRLGSALYRLDCSVSSACWCWAVAEERKGLPAINSPRSTAVNVIGISGNRLYV